MSFPKLPRERGGHFSIGYHYMQLALKRIRDLRILSGFHFCNQTIEAGAQGRIGDFVLVAQSFERPGAQNESLQELTVFFIQRFQPRRQRIFHKINVQLNFV